MSTYNPIPHLAVSSRTADMVTAPPPAAASPTRPRRSSRDAVFAVLWLFVLTIPFLNVVQFGSVGTLSRAVGLALAPVAAFSVLREGRRRRLRDFHVLAVAFMLWGAASLAWTISPERSVKQVYTIAQLLVMVLCIWEFSIERSRQLSLLRAYVLGSGITCVALLSQPGDTVDAANRYTVSAAHPNAVAFTLCLAIPIAWYLSLVTRRAWASLAYRLFVPAALIGILLTGSRSALIVAAIGLMIIPLTLARPTELLAVVVIAVAAVLGMALVPSGPLERLSTMGTELQQGDLNGRTGLWEASWALFSDRPLVGVGVGASREGIEVTSGVERVSHNTFLTVATELGAVGLALFCLVLLTVAKSALSAAGLDRRFTVVLLLTLVLGLQPRSWDHEKATWVVLALLVGHTARNELVAGSGRPRSAIPPAAEP